jgi:hypothetical protein
VYVATESPRGELGCYLVGDGGPKPYRVHFRTPSLAHLQVLPLLSKGHFVADLVGIIGSADIVLGDADRDGRRVDLAGRQVPHRDRRHASQVPSGVRALGVVISSPFIAFISLKSAVYFLLVTLYGLFARNCAAWFSTNGVTFPHPGANAKSNSGVKRYSPGRVPCGSAKSCSGVSDPSDALNSRMAAAAACPTAIPAALAAPFGIAARAAA